MTMNPPLKGSLEELLDASTDRDAVVITKRIVDTGDGLTKKEESSYTLTE